MHQSKKTGSWLVRCMPVRKGEIAGRDIAPHVKQGSKQGWFIRCIRILLRVTFYTYFKIFKGLYDPSLEASVGTIC